MSPLLHRRSAGGSPRAPARGMPIDVAALLGLVVERLGDRDGVALHGARPRLGHRCSATALLATGFRSSRARSPMAGWRAGSTTLRSRALCARAWRAIRARGVPGP
jgi:hypothetical protein